MENEKIVHNTFIYRFLTLDTSWTENFILSLFFLVLKKGQKPTIFVK